MNFNGFDEWISIFKGGKQTDSNGHTHDGDDIIKKALSLFDIGNHEPPLVIGHPNDNSPAFGWVYDLRSEVIDGTKVLMAKFKQIVPEFAAMVKSGLYKKRSAAFYPDGRLRHVGFLGATPPAVKGLADIKFEADTKSIFFNSISFSVLTAGEKVNEKALSIMEKRYPKSSNDRLHGGFQFNDAFVKSLEIVRINEPDLFEQYMNEY